MAGFNPFKLKHICIPNRGDLGTKTERIQNLMKLAKDYKTHSEVKDRLTNTQLAQNFSRYFRLATKKNIKDGHVPSVEELKRIYRYVDRGINDLSQGRISEFQSMMWLPAEIAKRSPELFTWNRTQSSIDGLYKGLMTRSNESMHQIAKLLKKEMGESGLFNMGNLTRPEAQKRIQKLEGEIKRHHSNKDWVQRDKVMEELDTFYKSEEGAAFKQLYELATDGKLWLDKARRDKKYSPSIVSAARIWRTELKPNLDKANLEAIDAYYWTFKDMKGELTNHKFFQDSFNKISAIRKALHTYIKDPKMKNEFPVQMLDIAPTLGKVYELYAVEGAQNHQAYKQANDMLTSLIKNVAPNMSIATNIYTGQTGQGNPSMNILPIMDSYIRTVGRFKLAAESNQNMTRAIQKVLKKQKTSDGQKAEELQTFIDYIGDRYATGGKSMVGDNLLRSLTNTQAILKLGLPNLRSPAKNLTQSFQHFTYWGWKGLKETREALKDPKMRLRIEANLKDNGILFQNIGEVYQGAEPTLVFDKKTGLYHEKIDQSFMDSINKSIQKAAETSMLGMTTVENMWNRKGAQQHGMVEKWNLDNLNPQLESMFQGYVLNKARRNSIPELQYSDGNSKIPYRKNFTEKEYKDWTKKVLNELHENRTHTVWEGEAPLTDYDYHLEFWRRKRAGDHADLVTGIIHFDYSEGGKPGIMRKSKAGAAGVLGGQFRTWWVNNMNYRKNLAKEGIDDIMAGQLGGDHAWRLYRMGMQSMLISGLISPLFNINLAGMVDNTSWWNALTLGVDTMDAISEEANGEVSQETKDKILQKTYGAGLAGAGAGVHFNELLRIGSILGMERLNQSDAQSYIWGMEQWGDLTKDERVIEFAATAHTGLGRMVTEHIPSLTGGAGVSHLLESEFGLKATKTQRVIKEYMMQTAGIDKKAVRETLTKPSRKLKRVSPYNIPEVELLQQMMAQIPSGQGKKADYESPAGLKASLDALLG